MIYGPGFAWTHLPRAAGDTTASLLALFPDLIEHQDDPEHPTAKHATFAARGVIRPIMALTLRRLPAWTLSWAVFNHRRNLNPHAAPWRRRLCMPTREDVLADLTAADRTLARYLDGPAITRWFRAEWLREDVLAFVARLRPVQPHEAALVAAVRTKPPLRYNHDAMSFFGPDGVRALYLANPAWAAIEEEVYRDYA